jgi:hypothetical protein
MTPIGPQLFDDYDQSSLHAGASALWKITFTQQNFKWLWHHLLDCGQLFSYYVQRPGCRDPCVFNAWAHYTISTNIMPAFYSLWRIIKMYEDHVYIINNLKIKSMKTP